MQKVILGSIIGVGILILINGCAAEKGVQTKAERPNINAGLVAWYTFDEGDGIIVHDSARGHNGVVHGATWEAGKIEGALGFDGVDNYVIVPDDPELNITGDITIAAWVNFSEGGLGYDDSEKAIVTKCVNNGAFNNPYDFRGDISIQPALTMVRANRTNHECLYSDKHIALDAWHHVAVRVKNMVTDFYVDGVLTGKSWGVPALKKPPTGNDKPMLIGARNDGLFFKGLIDEVRIYNRALTVEEIGELHKSGDKMLVYDVLTPEVKDFEK